MKEGKVLKRYHVSMGRNRMGHKQQEGDYRTPEGIYCISEKNPQSQFYKSLRISYPNVQDVQQAMELGVPPGGDIMIHGIAPRYANLGNPYEYTRGCIALANHEMDEVWSMIDPGTTIEIRP
jgi:murein L,D-transpeptidase YafK